MTMGSTGLADADARNRKDQWRMRREHGWIPQRAMHVFTYGSLMFPPVWQRVTGGTHVSAPAVLADHAAWQINGQPFPGLTEAPGETTEGIVYFDVDDEAVARLDRFEGATYSRSVVTVRLHDHRLVEAAVYLASAGARPGLSRRRWTAAEFRDRCLSEILPP
jgi:cation transport regulator ChaC